MAKPDKNDSKEAQAQDGENSVDDAGKKGGSKKKKIILISLLLVLILGLLGAGYFSGMIFKTETVTTESGEVEEVDSEGNKIVYYELDEFIVNLDVGTKLPTFLKMKVILELQGEDQVPIIEEQKPRIIDSFQVYLRTLRKSDLRGAKILEPLRMELTSRITRIAYPVKINRILFKELLVQ